MSDDRDNDERDDDELESGTAPGSREASADDDSSDDDDGSRDDDARDAPAAAESDDDASGDDRESDDSSADDADDEDAGDERVAARSRGDDDGEVDELEQGEMAPITALLGLERWVQFAFIAVGLLIFYVADNLITYGWGRFAEPDPTITSGSAALVGILGAFLMYRDSRVNELAHEVASELSKVTWPTRSETYYATVVVIVTSAVAALYTGVFDAVWSNVTDLIYNLHA